MSDNWLANEGQSDDWLANAIEIRGLVKGYGSTPVLRGLDLDVPQGSVTAVLGASGSGKTTLLRLIAGFEDPDAGRITMDGRTLADGRRTMRPQHRGVGYVPQDATLFPHLTVAGNIAFGRTRHNRIDDIGDLIDLVGLNGLERRYPYQLSGGQQQRVALARALAVKPRVVLLDEPFGSLDATLRESVRAEVIAILTQTRTTAILVTHDQDEALSLADHIALLDAGSVLAHGQPRELYNTPATPQIATAIGTANILDGRLAGGLLECALGRLPTSSQASAAELGCQVLLRPEEIAVSADPLPGQAAATIERIRYHGHDTLIDLTLDDPQRTELVARLAGESPLRAGQRVWLRIAGVPHVWPSNP